MDFDLSAAIQPANRPAREPASELDSVSGLYGTKVVETEYLVV